VTPWHPTHALIRAGLVSVAVLVLAVTTGRIDMLALGVPFAVHAWFGLRARPERVPTVVHRLAHTWLREGEGTRSRTRFAPAHEIEEASVLLAAQSFVAFDPPYGARSVSGCAGAHTLDVDMQVATLRWGARDVAEVRAVATSAWAGYYFGPVEIGASPLITLPVPPPFDTRAPVPHPIGLVGTHPARRPGGGSEFAGIRRFQPGDRLRRVHWRVSLRTGTLHTTTTLAEEDSSVLLIVDATLDVGVSGGIHGSASSLDRTVRAAGALSEHYLSQGDRVGVRVLGPARPPVVHFGAGRRHLRRVLDTLARVVPSDSGDETVTRMRFQVPAGAVVFVLGPMLGERAFSATHLLARRGLTVVVVDTLPEDLDLGDAGPAERIAWRIRHLEREALLGRLARTGVPVVPWRGPGTLDEVLRRLSRRRTGVGR
jgi:uncharacterized protein (DUF58 family)